MTTELQNKVWSVLPKEFRDGMSDKYIYACEHCEESYWYGVKTELEYFFGEDNLTSDAEGEEMVCCERKWIQQMYADGVGTHYLLNLFGSKCLPDEKQIAENANCKESKPAKPKFKVSDKVCYVCPTIKHKCTVTKVTQNEHSDKYEYNVMFEWGKPGMWIPESDLEPYTEPKEDHIVEDHDMVKDFDTILKDSFRNDRRCNIAVQMIKALTQSPEIVDRISSGCDDGLLDGILHDALYLTDKLIAECEKGGQS